MVKPANPFEWSGGHPALDLVNTLDERPSGSPVETLATYGDLVRFAGLARLIEPSVAERLRSLEGPACARIARRARDLREHLHAVLAAVHRARPIPRDAMGAIASAVRQAHAARAFAAAGGSRLATHCWRAPSAPDIPLHACALAIESLLVDAKLDEIRKCGAHDCDVYFVDTSKGHRRLWCSMQNCGNREKQRRWRSGAP